MSLQSTVNPTTTRWGIFSNLQLISASHEWGRREMHIGYWWESQKERYHKEDQDVGGWTMFK
jgi:hypothetical protein